MWESKTIHTHTVYTCSLKTVPSHKGAILKYRLLRLCVYFRKTLKKNVLKAIID